MLLDKLEPILKDMCYMALDKSSAYAIQSKHRLGTTISNIVRSIADKKSEI